MDVITWQRIEGAGLFLAALSLFVLLEDGAAWWLAAILFFVPDISFVAYLAGPKVGAFAYNFTHLYAFGGAILVVGVGQDAPLLASLGSLWIAHAGFDRTLGYGLKTNDGFTVTHLGTIGR